MQLLIVSLLIFILGKICCVISAHKLVYFVISLKTFWIVKEMHLPTAHTIFEYARIQFTAQGRWYLGAAIGFADLLSHVLVIKWKSGLMNYPGCQRLVLLSHTQLILLLPMGYWADKFSCPECCLVLVNGFLHWNRLFIYTCSLLCQVNLISVMLRKTDFITITFGWTWHHSPCVSSVFQLSTSQRVTGPLVSLLLDQNSQFTTGILNEKLAFKQETHLENHCRFEELAASLHPLLFTELQHVREFACLKGASCSFTTLSLDEHDFSLHKGDFRDAVCLRYGWSLSHLPTECVCGASFTDDHPFTCPHSDYPTLLHNEIRDITAQLMSEICPNMNTLATLLSVTHERFSLLHKCWVWCSPRYEGTGVLGVHHQQAYVCLIL